MTPERGIVNWRERERVCVFVCVCVREREREKDGAIKITDWDILVTSSNRRRFLGGEFRDAIFKARLENSKRALIFFQQFLTRVRVYRQSVPLGLKQLCIFVLKSIPVSERSSAAFRTSWSWERMFLRLDLYRSGWGCFRSKKVEQESLGQVVAIPQGSNLM